MDLDVPVIGILRGIAPEFFGEVLAASFDAGLQAIEVTFNTDGAAKMISDHVAAVPAGRYLGMGTIRNIAEARIAVAAGAMFMVTPNLDEGVIEYAHAAHVPVVAGAFTPTEVYRADAAGAHMVKVFPSGVFGPDYIRDLAGPYDQISLVAVGGVRRDNINAFLQAGAAAVGVGQSLFGREALQRRDAAAVAEHVKGFLAAIDPQKVK